MKLSVSNEHCNCCVPQAYASGCDIVILGSDFERLQIIPGAKHGNIQVGCVDCSQQGGQVRGSLPSYRPLHKSLSACDHDLFIYYFAGLAH